MTCRHVLVLLVLASAACAPEPEADRLESEAVRDSVRALIERIPTDLASEGPAGWMPYFLDDRSFFMASDGRVVFPSRDSARAFLDVFAEAVASMDLVWDSIRVEPVGPGLAVVAASYHESITGIDSSVVKFGGFMTGLARHVDGRWTLQHLHWSSPPPAGD